MSMAGHRLCGAVRVTLPEPVRTADACHCGICRRLCGGGPMVAVHAPGGARPEVEGAEHLGTYRSSDRAERTVCATCGTPVWYRFVEDDVHALSAGLFDPGGLRLTKQIVIEDKPGLYDLANDTPRLTGAQVVAESMAEKAKHQGSAS